MSLRRRSAGLIDKAPWTVRVLGFTLAVSVAFVLCIGVLFAAFSLAESLFPSERLRSLFALGVFVVVVLGATQALVVMSR